MKPNLHMERCIPDSLFLEKTDSERKTYIFKSFSTDKKVDKELYLLDFLRFNLPIDKDFMDLRKLEGEHGKCTVRIAKDHIVSNLRKFNEVKQRLISKLLDDDYLSRTDDFNHVIKNNRLFNILKVIVDFNEYVKEEKPVSLNVLLSSMLKLDMINLRLDSFLQNAKCRICALEVPVWQFKTHDDNCYQYNASKDEIILINDKLLECIKDIKHEAEVFDYKQIINTKKQLLQENYRKMKSESLKNSLNKTFYGSFSGKKSEYSSTNMNNYLFANKTTYENPNNKSRFFTYKRPTNESLSKIHNDSWGDINKVHSNSVRPSIDLQNSNCLRNPVVNILGSLNVQKEEVLKKDNNFSKTGNIFNRKDSKDSSDTPSSDDNMSNRNGELVGDIFKSMDYSDEESRGGVMSKNNSKRLSDSRNIGSQFNSSNKLKSTSGPPNPNINDFDVDNDDQMKSPHSHKKNSNEIEYDDENEKIKAKLLKNQTSITNLISPDKNIYCYTDEAQRKRSVSNIVHEVSDRFSGKKNESNTISLNQFKISSSRFKTQNEIGPLIKSRPQKEKKASSEKLNTKHSDMGNYTEDAIRGIVKLNIIINNIHRQYCQDLFDFFFIKDTDDRIIEVTSEYKSWNSSNKNSESDGNAVLLGDRFESMDDDDSQQNKENGDLYWKNSENANSSIENLFPGKNTVVGSGMLNKNFIEPASGQEYYDSDGGFKIKRDNIIDQIDSPLTGSKHTRVDKKDTSMALGPINTEKKGWLNHGSKKLLNNIFSIEAYKKSLNSHKLEYNPKTNQFDRPNTKAESKIHPKPRLDNKKDLYNHMNRTYYINPEQQKITKNQIWNYMSKASKTEYHKTAVINELDEQYYFYLFNKDIVKYKEHLLTHPYVQNFFYDQEFLVSFETYENKLRSQHKKKLLTRLKRLIEKRIAKAKRMVKFHNNIESLQHQVKGRKLLKEAISRSFGNFSVLEESLSKANDNKSKNDGMYPQPKRNELLEKSLLNSIKKDINSKNIQPTLNQKDSSLPDDNSTKINKRFRKLKRNLSDSEFVAINTKEKIYEEKTKVVDINDFLILKELGAGAFGKVFLVKHKISGEFYAMKVLKLGAQHDDKYINALLNEIKILNIISSEFLVKAYFSFIHNTSLCIVMEYMIGGDVRGLLNEWGILDNETTKYYAAQLVLAVDSLHTNKIVHRDLKPENLLLNNKGQLKLADFGLSEIHRKIQSVEYKNASDIDITDNEDITKSLVVERTIEIDLDDHKKSTKKIKVVGTPDYIAPEILFPPSGFEQVSDKYCEAVDWWAAGCLIYEFVVGVSTFGAMTIDDVFNNIKERNIEWPEIGYGEDKMNPEAKDLIEKLLNPDPIMRLGTMSVEEIKSHKFFKGVDWSKIHKMNSPLNIDLKPDFKNLNPKASFKIASLIPNKSKHNKKILSTYNKLKMNRVDLLHDFNVDFYQSLKQKYHALHFQKQLSSKNIFIELYK